MFYGICVIHSIWRLVVIKWIEKGLEYVDNRLERLRKYLECINYCFAWIDKKIKWVDYQVALLNKDGDIEAEHKIIFVFGGLLFAFMMVAFIIALFRYSENFWMLTDASFFIVINLVVGHCIWKIKNKKLWMFDLTILLHFLCLFLTFYFVMDNESSGYFAYILEIMIMIFCCWWISYYIGLIVLPSDFKNVFQNKAKRLTLKLLIILVLYFTIIFLLMDIDGSMITAFFAIVLSLVNTKEFFNMIQLFSNHTFSDDEISELIKKTDGRFTKLKVLALLFELSFLLSFYLSKFINLNKYLNFISKNFGIERNRSKYINIDLVIMGTIFFIGLMMALNFLVTKVYLKPIKDLQNKKD